MKSKLHMLFLFVAIVATSNLIGQKKDSIIRKAVIIPKSEYVLSGEKYLADIMLIEYNPETKAEAVVNGSRVLLGDGIAYYEVTPTEEGWHSVSGYIEYGKGKRKEKLEFTNEFCVYKSTAVISANQMNVLYIGVDNPISIAVPGFPSEKVSATIMGGVLIKTHNTSYIAKVRTLGEATIKVYLKNEDDNTTAIGSAKFSVRNLPTPVATFGTILSGDVQPVDIIKSNAGRIFCSLGEGFTFEGVKYIVKSFSFRVIKANGTVTKVISSPEGAVPNDTNTLTQEQDKPVGAGDKLPAEALSQIEAIQPGDIILIDKIKVLGPGRERDAQPIIITAK